jgi:hypothetical protein
VFLELLGRISGRNKRYNTTASRPSAWRRNPLQVGCPALFTKTQFSPELERLINVATTLQLLN